MLLIDRGNEPTNTVYYLAAVSYGVIMRDSRLDVTRLYEVLTDEVLGHGVNFDFLLLALDFLFLLDKVDVNEEGLLYVH